MLSAAKHLVAGWGKRRGTLLTGLAFGGVAMMALSLLPWVQYHWLNEDCPSCGADGVYLIDYADSGLEVNGMTDFGDGLAVAAAGLLVTLLALIALRFGKHHATALLGIAMAATSATCLAVYDATKDWTVIERKGAIPVGTWYPRLIAFDTHPLPALYGEIALSAMVTLVVLVLIALDLKRTSEGLAGRAEASGRGAWAQR